MDKVVNLQDHRKPKAEGKPTLTEDKAQELLNDLVENYLSMACEQYPLGLILAYAQDAIEMEIRSIPFEVFMERIEKEFPDLALQFKKDMA